MNQDHFGPIVSGAHELTDLELMQVQGGSLFSSVSGWVSNAASAVVDVVSHPVDSLNAVVTSRPFRMVAAVAQQIAEYIVKHPPIYN